LQRLLLFLAVIAACSQPKPEPKPPFKEQLIRTDSTVTLKKLVNNQQVEIINIIDSLLLFSQENTKTDTISLENCYLFAFSDNMDLNADSYKDLVIYGSPNIHGQCKPFVFLSNKEGKLRYRPDLSLMNIQYDTVSKRILSFYLGGAYTEHTKESYAWENDSLKFLRGASFQVLSPRGEPLLVFYKGKDKIPYRTLKNCCEELWDTAVFKNYPDFIFSIEI
jgi:hypothetical protein